MKTIDNESVEILNEHLDAYSRNTYLYTIMTKTWEEHSVVHLNLPGLDSPATACPSVGEND